MARSLLSDDTIISVKESELDLTIPIDEDAVYSLRLITVETARSIYKTHTRSIQSRRSHQREDVTDFVSVQNALLDYAIVRWEGVKNGKDLAPCDLEHKLKLPGAVQVALIERAQLGPSPEAKEDSFRKPA